MRETCQNSLQNIPKSAHALLLLNVPSACFPPPGAHQIKSWADDMAVTSTTSFSTGMAIQLKGSDEIMW